MRPPLLYIVHRFPYPPDKGDRIRTFNLLRFLSGHAAVHVACLADEPVDEGALATLKRYCERIEVVPIGRRTRWLRALQSFAAGKTVSEGAFESPTLRRTVRAWSAEVRFRVAVASASSMAPYLMVPELATVPKAVDLIDVDSQKWFDYAAASRGPKAWLYRVEGRRLRRLEERLAAVCRALTVVSEHEADIFRDFADVPTLHAVPNGVDLDYFQPITAGEERACVFVGALDYRPNVDGALWFCREVWPTLRAREPQLTLYLVGRRPVPAVCELGRLPGVVVVGQVPDVRPHVARAAVTVVPLRIARGVQNKVLEAMALGRPVIASPESLAGLRAEPGVHALAASTPGEWVEAISSLLKDEDWRRRLGRAAREYVEEQHRWDVCLAPMLPLLGLEPAVVGAA